MKNSNDTIGNRTRDLLTCSAVPQPTAPPRSLYVTFKVPSYNHFCRGKAISVAYSECVYSLRYRAHNANTYLQFFTTLSYKLYDLRTKNVIEIKMRVLTLSKILSRTFIIVRRTERGTITTVHWPSREVPLFLSDFNTT